MLSIVFFWIIKFENYVALWRELVGNQNDGAVTVLWLAIDSLFRILSFDQNLLRSSQRDVGLWDNYNLLFRHSYKIRKNCKDFLILRVLLLRILSNVSTLNVLLFLWYGRKRFNNFRSDDWWEGVLSTIKWTIISSPVFFSEALCFHLKKMVIIEILFLFIGNLLKTESVC